MAQLENTLEVTVIKLTKREYFAAMAMQGMIASGQWPQDLIPECASYAVQYADALLNQLKQDADFAASLKA